MRRRTFLARAAGFSLVGLSASAVRAPAVIPTSRRMPPRYVDRWSWAMGQPVRLQLFHASEAAGYEAAQATFAELRRVEARLSRFDDLSDLSELNRQAGRGWVPVADDLRAVLRQAGHLRRLTSGAFDIAVEPLMRTWGFRDWRQAEPGGREIAAAREALAATTIEIDARRVRLGREDAALDLGGVGVGYGLDRAGEVLRRHGVQAALLDVSGDLLAIGAPPGTDGWPVDIVDPRRAGGVLATAVIRDEALATSGVTIATVVLSGRPHGHVVDPGRGAPVEQRLQATVVVGSGVAADALSTALLVGGSSWPGVRRHWVVPRDA